MRNLAPRVFEKKEPPPQKKTRTVFQPLSKTFHSTCSRNSNHDIETTVFLKKLFGQKKSSLTKKIVLKNF
jgi:hypothetical protein